MVRNLIATLVVCAVFVGMAYAGSGSKSRVHRPVDLKEEAVEYTEQMRTAPQPYVPQSDPPVGTYTTLTGFYDYQVNGGAAQYVRVDPATGDIHVTYMLSDDSTSTSPARGVGYALSSDGGATWDNFSNVRVPGRRAGFATIDLMQGPFAGLPIIADHTELTSGADPVVAVSIGNPPGTFVELGPVPQMTPTQSDEPIWPFVAGASDGSIVFHASTSSGETNWLTRTDDFITWAAWFQYPDTNDAGGRYVTLANGTGRVGSLLNAVTEGVFWLESTDNGVTWPTSATTIHPPFRIAGEETLGVWVGSDFVYNGDDVLVALNTAPASVDSAGVNSGLFDFRSRIDFWSEATGFVNAVVPGSTVFLDSLTGNDQTNHFAIGYPAIGMSGSRIVVAFNAFQPDTSEDGWNYSDIWYTQSADGGATWAVPANITNSASLDERYPSISKYNEDGFANIVWQEDTVPAAHAFNDGAPVSRSNQVFLKLELPPIVPTSVPGEGGFAASFKLDQNYPNPFNPSTNIRYSIPAKSLVTLKIFSVLGQEIATLVNSEQEAGSYVANFDASELSSGVYLYKLQAGSFTETKKMMLVK